MQHTHKTEYHAAIKKSEVLILRHVRLKRKEASHRIPHTVYRSIDSKCPEQAKNRQNELVVTEGRGGVRLGSGEVVNEKSDRRACCGTTHLPHLDLGGSHTARVRHMGNSLHCVP